MGAPRGLGITLMNVKDFILSRFSRGREMCGGGLGGGAPQTGFQSDSHHLEKLLMSSESHLLYL